ncbi:MAG: DUF4124 domain-containing protein [Pseudomonadota bacterium]
MMKKIIFILMLSAGFSLLPFSAIADSNKIVKWKDSNGVTHYGDKLPAQEAGRNNVEMRNNGVVIKKNIRVDQKTGVLDQQKEQEKLAQERADKVLLASYTNSEEIDLACERNLQTDQAALQSLAQHKHSIVNRTTHIKKSAQKFKQKNKAMPAYLSEELKQYQQEIDTVNKKIAQHKLNMEVISKRYAEEKNRFTTLKQSSLAISSPAMTASLNTH